MRIVRHLERATEHEASRGSESPRQRTLDEAIPIDPGGEEAAKILDGQRVLEFGQRRVEDDEERMVLVARNA